MTELTAVSTFGWFAAEGYDVDLLTAISTFGWYGVTLEELQAFTNTVNFGLIIDQLHELGLEIEIVHEGGNTEILTSCPLGELSMTQIFNVRLKR
jgi:TctA family transporter